MRQSSSYAEQRQTQHVDFMLLFLVLILLAGACYGSAKSWTKVLRNIVIAEVILIGGLVVALYLTAQIEQSDQIHVHSAEDLVRLFIGNVLLDTLYVFVVGFGAYGMKKLLTRLAARKTRRAN